MEEGVTEERKVYRYLTLYLFINAIHRCMTVRFCHGNSSKHDPFGFTDLFDSLVLKYMRNYPEKSSIFCEYSYGVFVLYSCAVKKILTFAPNISSRQPCNEE